MTDTIFIGFGDEDSPGSYRIAGHAVNIRPALPALEPFSTLGQPGHDRVPIDPEGSVSRQPVPGQAPFLRRAEGWVAGRDRWVECRAWPGGRYALTIEGIGSFRILPDGGDTLIATELPVSDLSVAAVFGPVLALTLGWRHVWILHASAVVREGDVRVFLGPSEAGKSTLAEYLASRSEEGWRAVADDLLPVRFREGGLEALPRYPQHGWSSGEQWSTGLPEALPIGALYRLGEPDPGVGEPALRGLAGRKAVETGVRQTLSAGLFDHLLLERHLEFCGRVAEEVPVFALEYPRDRALLPTVEGLLLDGNATASKGEEHLDLEGRLETKS